MRKEEPQKRLACPLLAAAAIKGNWPDDAKCLGESCACWDRDGVQCCLQTIAQSLFVLADEVKTGIDVTSGGYFLGGAK